jgi:hypothetical protein
MLQTQLRQLLGAVATITGVLVERFTIPQKSP